MTFVNKNQRSIPIELKKHSFSTLLNSGRNKKIKENILIYLQDAPMSAKQLSEKIPCMRSSVCYALNKLCKKEVISQYQSIYDVQTNRTVTLYSLVECQVH